MRSRHKIPAVFSIYMVDVLCCALGCVILLWQLYHHESEEQTAANGEIRKQNDEIRQQLDDAIKTAEARYKQNVQIKVELADTSADRDKAIKLALVHQQKYDDMKNLLGRASAMLDVLRLDLKNKDRQNAVTAAELAEKIRAHADLFDKLAQAEKKLRVLTKDLALRDADSQEAAKRSIEKGNLLKLLEQELNVLRAKQRSFGQRGDRRYPQPLARKRFGARQTRIARSQSPLRRA